MAHSAFFGADGSRGESKGGGGDEKHEAGLAVQVTVDGNTFTINAGMGFQTARWLALAATQRALKAASSVRGPRKVGGFVSSRKPINLKLSRTGAIVPPQARITEIHDQELSEGAKLLQLELELSPPAGEIVLSETGELPQTTWAAMAYNFSPAGIARTTKKLEKERLLDELRRKEEEKKRKAEEDAKYDHLAKLLVVDFEDPAAVETALQHDWEFVRVEEMVFDPDEISKVKLSLLKRYVAINDVYQYFSGGSNVGSLDSMNQSEWTQFLVSLPNGLFSIAHDAMEGQKVFRTSTTGREDDDDAHSLSRFEFMEAIIRLAKWKFCVARRGESATLLSVAVERLLEDYLVPLAASLGIADIRKALGSPELRKLFGEAMPALDKVFAKYSAADTRETKGDRRKPGRDDSSLNFAEFCQVLLDAGLLNDNRHPPQSKYEMLTITEARQCFAGVQRENIEDANLESHGDAKLAEEEDEGESQELDKPEFLEALARVAHEKWEGGDIDMSIEEKVKRAVGMVVALVKVSDVIERRRRSLADERTRKPAGASGVGGKSSLV